MSATNFSQAEHLAAVGWAREDLYAFDRWMFLQRRHFKWAQGQHHAIVADALMRVFRGEIKRLIINEPPRYSKTQQVTDFVAWSLGKVPDAEFIYTSYSGDLAENNSWNTRDQVAHEAYRELFPEIALTASARNHWKTSAGGVVYAAGAGGTITGYGAGKMRPGFSGALIIDDPHKADEARSDVKRPKVIEWFQNTLESRLNSPDTPIILIMQRLHEADLAGWLLGPDPEPGQPRGPGGNGEVWHHVCIEAIRPDGTALWPAKHSIERLLQMQASAPYTFSGQYQQRPSPPEGNIFKPDQIAVCTAIPIGTRFVRAWDLAASDNDGDWTVGALLGLMPDGRYLIADIRRFQGRPDEVEAGIRNAAGMDGTSVDIELAQDPGQAGKSQIVYLTKMLAGYTVHSSPESGDKVTRAEPFASQVNVGNVAMLAAEWNSALIGELRLFPNGTFDDQVDALSRGFNALTGGGTWAFGSM